MSKRLIYSYSLKIMTEGWCDLGEEQIAKAFDGMFCCGETFVIDADNHVEVLNFIEPLVYADVKGAQELNDIVQSYFSLNEKKIFIKVIKVEETK